MPKEQEVEGLEAFRRDLIDEGVYFGLKGLPLRLKEKLLKTHLRGGDSGKYGGYEVICREDGSKERRRLTNYEKVYAMEVVLENRLIDALKDCDDLWDWRN